MNKLFKEIRNRKIDMVNIQVTSNCNYKCGMCPFHGEGYSGGYFSERPSIQRELTILELKNILQKSIETGVEKIDLTPNGEFFTHRNWKEILKTIKSFGLRAYITTNGGLLSENDIKELCDIGVAQITFSIDSVDYESYKLIRKPATKKAFNRAINAPILVKRYAKDDIYVQLQITEQPENLEEVEKILQFYSPYSFNQIAVNKMFVTSDKGISHYGVEKDKEYIHCACKSYGSPIVMPDMTVLPCCGAFYFYPKLNDKIPKLKNLTLKEATKTLDDIYEFDETFKKYCKNCSLYSINNDEKVTTLIEGKYFVLRDKMSSRYFKIPFKLYILPKNIILWLYSKGYIKILKNLFSIVVGR